MNFMGKPIPDERSVDIMVNGEWVRNGEFKDIKKGDVFRLIESTGEVVLPGRFIALSNPYPNMAGVLTIDVNVLGE